MHYFSLPFLKRMASHLQQNATYHLALKSIPSISGSVKVATPVLLAYRCREDALLLL